MACEYRREFRRRCNRKFTVVREDETAFEVIRRMWRRKAIMAVVVRGRGVPRGSDVAGVITKEHVADSVADSVKAIRNKVAISIANHEVLFYQVRIGRMHTGEVGVILCNILRTV
jgi:hypothetical protein